MESSWELPRCSLHIFPHQAGIVEVGFKKLLDFFHIPFQAKEMGDFCSKTAQNPYRWIHWILHCKVVFQHLSLQQPKSVIPQPLLCTQWRLCGQVLQVSWSGGGGEEVEYEALCMTPTLAKHWRPTEPNFRWPKPETNFYIFWKNIKLWW